MEGKSYSCKNIIHVCMIWKVHCEWICISRCFCAVLVYLIIWNEYSGDRLTRCSTATNESPQHAIGWPARKQSPKLTFSLFKKVVLNWLSLHEFGYGIKGAVKYYFVDSVRKGGRGAISLCVTYVFSNVFWSMGWLDEVAFYDSDTLL